MSNSARLGLPYLDAAQAQKHVTVNEALARLDVIAARSAATMDLTAPPASPADGEAHVVATGATGAWAGADGQIAVFLNGGWDFVAPWAGLRLWVDAIHGFALFVGTAWAIDWQGQSPQGALTLPRVVEIDHVVAAGAASATAAFIPDKAVVLGVTARVTGAVGGATGWSLGVTGSADRYGTGFGTALNAFAHGVTASPLAYFGGSSLLLTAEGSAFTGGTVRIAAHLFELSPPYSV